MTGIPHLRAIRRARLLVALAAVCGVSFAALGCSGNEKSTLLVPTGIRPAPAVPTGGLTGLVFFDSTTYPGLGSAPLPRAVIQVLNGATVVAETLTTTADRSFTIERLPPGDYGVVARSHAFSPRAFGPFRVVDRIRDAGDLALTANTRDSLASLAYLIGTMPGFGTEELGTFATYCDANLVGRWTYPNVLFPPNVIPAGTYRLKFVTDASSTPGHLIGWGGDGSTAHTVPLNGVPARFGTDAASDLIVTFPATASYDFVFDERRLTIDISPTPAAAAARTLASGTPPSPWRP